MDLDLSSIDDKPAFGPDWDIELLDDLPRTITIDDTATGPTTEVPAPPPQPPAPPAPPAQNPQPSGSDSTPLVPVPVALGAPPAPPAPLGATATRGKTLKRRDLVWKCDVLQSYPTPNALR